MEESDAGSTSATDCYEKITCTRNADSNQHLNCRQYYGNTIKCDSNGNWITGFHTESNGSCYANSMDCKRFRTSTACNISAPVQGGSYNEDFGIADWDEQRQEWNVSKCRAECIGATNVAKNCIASGTFSPSTNVESISNNINFDTTENYYCTGCTAGHYATIGLLSGCVAPNGRYTVCQCSPAGKGYYVNSCHWTYPLSVANIPGCQPTPCPAGKTTDGTGSAGASACKYTPQTKFCDSKGCFTLGDDINNWNEI
jgi:hypothetical protein